MPTIVYCSCVYMWWCVCVEGVWDYYAGWRLVCQGLERK